MNSIYIYRIEENEIQTLGDLELRDSNGDVLFSCLTLELPNLNNRQNVSRINAGVYDFEIYNSPKFGKVIHLLNVEGRTWILIHFGNYYTDVEGCILVGDRYKDINNDGQVDVLNSKITLEKLMGSLVGNTGKVHIIDNF